MLQDGPPQLYVGLKTIITQLTIVKTIVHPNNYNYIYQKP